MIVLFFSLFELVFLFAVQVCLSNPAIFSYLVEISISVILYLLCYMVVLTSAVFPECSLFCAFVFIPFSLCLILFRMDLIGLDDLTLF